MNINKFLTLDFIMSLSDDEFDVWCKSATCEQILYALELIRNAKSKLDFRIIEELDDVIDVAEASDILKKYTL